MTPTRIPQAQQPKEYIITEEELDHFVTCSSKSDCVDCKYSAPEFQCTPRIMANKIRSRPHPAPMANQGPDEKELYWYERGLRDGAEKARQAREDAIKPLQELKGYMEAWKRANVTLDDIEKGENVVLDQYIPFLEKAIESLRGEHEVQE